MINKLKENIGSVFVGKENVIDLLIVSLLADGHVLLEDVPGTGKTLLAKTLSKSIGGNFSRVQFTPDVLPSDVTGIEYFNRLSLMWMSISLAANGWVYEKVCFEILSN